MLDFDLTEEQRLLEQSVREWGAREVRPKIHDLDREHRFDPGIFPQMADLGLLGARCPPSTAAPAWTTSASASSARSSNTSTRRCA